MKNNKVYCITCKHKKFYDYLILDVYKCKAHPKSVESYFSNNYVMEECKIKNRNNDCPDYEAQRTEYSRWNKLVTFFFKKLFS